jgi:hypothetical protein
MSTQSSQFPAIDIPVPTREQADRFIAKANELRGSILDWEECCEAADLNSWDCDCLGDGSVILGLTWLVEREARIRTHRNPPAKPKRHGGCAFRWRLVNL